MSDLVLKKQIKPENSKRKQQKEDTLENLYNLSEGREKVLNASDSKRFPIQTNATRFLNFDHSKLKILTTKQMLQRLPIALAQIKAGNNSESLLNEIRQFVYSLNQSKEITKKVYNNIIKSVKI